MSKKSILIFGSCVTRDMFNFPDAQQFELVDIFARSSPASLMSEPASSVPDLSANKSAFQRRMVAWDMQKHFWGFIKNTDFDAIVFDFIDERYRQVYLGDGWVTRSNEILEAKVVDKDAPGFGWPDEQYKTLFVAGLQAIRRALISLNRKITVVLNQAYWATHFDTDEKLTDYTSPYIARNNVQLAWVHEQFKAIFSDAAVIEYADDLLRTKKGHTWGEAPYHYRDAFYEDSIRQLALVFAQSRGKLMASSSPDCLLGSVVAGKARPKVSLSVDVEALPSRTREADKISRLMWGKFPDQQYGVPELVRIFKKFNVPATFFVEYLAAKVYGKEAVFSVGQYLANEGFRVEMHAHPELLRALGSAGAPNSFAAEPFSQQMLLLKEIKALRDENLTPPGEIFRAGGLKYNADTIRAAAGLNIKYLSNFYVSPHVKLSENRKVPLAFQWDGGPVELPVSACIDEIIQAGPDWKERLSNLLPSESGVRHFFIHSWSLTKRDKDGFHDTPDNDYSARFEEIIRYLSSTCDLVDMVPASPNEIPSVSLLDLVESMDGRPSVEFRADHLKGSVRLSSAHLARSKSQYQLHYKETGAWVDNDIPAYLAPVNVAPGQSAVSVRIASGGRTQTLPLVISGQRAFIQLKREQFPFDELINETVSAVFKLFPGVQEMVFGHLYGQGLLSSPFVNSKLVGATYVLDLPESFESYVQNVISHDFLKLVERKGRALKRDFPNHLIRFFGGAGDEGLSADVFEQLIDVVRHRMVQKANDSGGIWTDPYTPEWVEKSLPIYQRSGCCAAIEIDGRIVAVSMNFVWNGSLYYMGGGFFDDLGGNYHLSKVLFLNLIRRSIDARVTRMQLGGGDFGFKERLGGKEVKLYSGNMVRPSAEFRAELVRKVEDARSLLGYGLRGVCIAAGVGSKHFLEGPVSKSLFNFDASVVANIPAGWRSATQVNIDALLLCLDAIGSSEHPNGAFDWNCGVGRNLLGLHEYFGCRVGGAVLDAGLREVALGNMRSGGVDAPELVFWDGSAPFDSSVLESYDLFFAYNPAYLKVMELVVDAMVARHASHPGKIRFIYVNPVYDEMVVGRGFAREIVLEKGVGNWRFGDKAIVYTLG